MGYFSRQLEQESNEIIFLRIKTRLLVDEMQLGFWSGKGADLFYDEMYCIILPAMERLSEALIDAALAAAKIAGIFQQAQVEAADKFKLISDTQLQSGGRSV
jgi:uncharacterized protein YukE